MPTLEITARFPTGQFNAHGADRSAHWPPAPSRVLAALLSTAYATGCGVEQIRALYALDPPVIHAPTASARDVDWRRWVPVNPGLKEGGRRVSWERTGKLDKDPERGVMVASDATVRWLFPLPDDERALDEEVVREVARAVPYLGRPTSPVLMDARIRQGSPHEQDAAAGEQVWTPDIDGAESLTVGTPVLLEALDRRESQRLGRSAGHHPELAGRPQARYRREGGADSDRAPTGTDVRRLAERTAYYGHFAPRPSRELRGQHAPMVMEQVRALMGDDRADSDTWVAPVVQLVGDERRPVLRGILAHGHSPEPELRVAVPEGVVALHLGEVSSTPWRFRALRRLVGPARIWTTLVPMPENDQLPEQVRDLAQRVRAEVVDAQVREVSPLDEVGDVARTPGRVHVVVEFDREVTGPVVMEGAALCPLLPDRG